MNKILEDNLARIIKRLMSENTINKTEISGDYNIIKNNFKELNSYMQNTFGLDLVLSNRGYALKKYSYNYPIGINNNCNKKTYIVFALTLSELAGMTTDQNFIWNTFFNDVLKIYENEYNNDLNTQDMHNLSKRILKYLLEEEYLNQIELNENNEETESLYSLKYTLDKNFYEKIDLCKYNHLNNDIRDNVRLVCQKLLLNGYIDKNVNETEYNLLSNQKIKERVFNVFIELNASEGVGFELVEWDNYYLLLQINGTGFPSTTTNAGVLAIELLNMFNKNQSYSFDEIKSLAETTSAYKNRAGVKNNLKDCLREVLNGLIHFNFITKQSDEYYVNGISTNIIVKYIE